MTFAPAWLRFSDASSVFRVCRSEIAAWFLCLGFMAPALVRGATLPELWLERQKSVVAVEYVTETEADRRPTVSLGTVIDAQGTIILPSNAIDPRAATW